MDYAAGFMHWQPLAQIEALMLSYFTGEHHVPTHAFLEAEPEVATAGQELTAREASLLLAAIARGD
jgi:hypothetical protein